jgi:hypothetical protein
MSDACGHLETDGYTFLRGLLRGTEVEELRQAFDEQWRRGGGRADQTILLESQVFLRLLEDPRLLAWPERVFAEQLQLLMYVLRRHEAGTDLPERDWHRDFSFVCDRPLAVNLILYLDATGGEVGPTLVVPGSHRWRHLPSGRLDPRPDEVALPAEPGDVLVNDAALWHSRGRNRSPSPRRLVILYFGYWWLKRYEWDRALPWQAFAGASPRRLQLLGLKMPGRDLHLYELAPDGPR